ncbi:hypothetical protein CPB84DRAFT_1837740 [Gymnopilus junonius]|uniref:Nucleoporin Nup188 N-terminal subdomain III domain-containing protein n=1 Tax=Gymnopilus junonius TaxID=109634 RepID=A0A9P5NH01_GYMJU|nr:hypothetical protein CPB84DRAFT_1837740 [Gymnopilus junonius]
MSGDSSTRSDLIDVTYFQLHSILSGHQDGVHPEQIKAYLEPRKAVLSRVTHPFGEPSEASKKAVESGNVTLPDGVALRVEEGDKEFIFAISSKLQIDEIQALIFLRSFLYNQGMPPISDPTSTSVMAAELVEAISPFYYSERLHALRVLIPLFRAKENADDPLYDVATVFLPEIIPDGPKFIEGVISTYLSKSKAKLPEKYREDPRGATSWAKQNVREQLVLLEVLFWAMWGFVPCSGPLVVKIFEAAYNTNLGSTQVNSTLLLDDESVQLQQDCAAIWILVTLEVLELETLSETPSRTDFQYACTFLAWTYVLSRLHARPQKHLKIMPSLNHSQPFWNTSIPLQEPAHVQMAKAALEPEVGLLKLVENLLTNSPVFVTALAWKRGSSVTDPNAIAYRSVMKVAFNHHPCRTRPVEQIPDFEGFVEVWIALFGRSESLSVSGICAQFWQTDWHHGISRRAIFDVARSRFPIQVRPLLRLLRVLTGVGFLDTDSLYQLEPLSPDRELCDRFVYHYMSRLSTYSQVIPVSACTGAHALYERTAGPGLTYVNVRPIRLPGGSVLPARSVGRLLSGDGGEYIVIGWQHEHSGWKIILEILTDYVNRRRVDYTSGGRVPRSGAGGHQQQQQQQQHPLKTFTIPEAGMELDAEGDEAAITDALDLVRSLIQDNAAQASMLMHHLEEGEPVVSHATSEMEPPDLVQLTTMILEEALSRTNGRARSEAGPTKLIISAISSHWALYNDLSLLHLVEQLFREAFVSIVPENTKLQQLKEEVLLRAARFVHTEIWVEHMTWKYAQLGDRFEIGTRIASLYIQVLENTPPTLQDRPFPILSQAVGDILLFKAATSTISPLVTSIASGQHALRMLYNSKRLGDVRRLIFLLQANLHLSRLVLTLKMNSTSGSRMASKACLLEQALSARVSGGGADVLASYIKDRGVGSLVPVEAARVLCALVTSLSISGSQPSPPTIIGHLTNPEATVASLVRIIQHPYDELALRKTVWGFVSLAVDKEPALATLFVEGRSRGPGEFRMESKDKDKDEKGKEGGRDKGKGKQKEGEEPPSRPTSSSALDAAREILVTWKELWEANPLLLACVFRFLDTVWQHFLEHKNVLEPLRKDKEFWERVVGVACEEIGPVPAYETTETITVEGVRRSNFHEAIQTHTYKTLVKSFAIHIVTHDIGLHIQLHGSEVPLSKPQSYLSLEPYLNSQDQLTDMLAEAAPSSCAPEMHDKLTELLKRYFPGLTLQQLEAQEPLVDRDYGDNFRFSMSLLRARLQAYPLEADGMDDPAEEVEKLLFSTNLNLSLIHSESAVLESWVKLLKQVIPYLRMDKVVRPIVLSIAASLSFDISRETREGDMMSTIHGTRLSLILALLEIAWFSSSEKKEEVDPFIELVKNLRNIILNDAQSPPRSFLSNLPNPFHRVLLQIIFFCIKQARSLLGRPKALIAQQRLDIALTVEPTLNFVIDSLNFVFNAARTRADVDLDRDMELLVTVFEQCTRPEIDVSSVQWLTRASLELYVHIDLVGLSDLPLLLSRKQPLYASHILLSTWHYGGVLSAYSNNFISSAISSGMIDVVLPELPGQRSPAHLAYCSMISIVAMVLAALGRQNHYFDADACGFIQFYGGQISRALSWTIGDPITLPLVEEIDQVINIFYAIATSVPTSAKSNPVVDKVLRVFTNRALHLLQQVNYAITHPNHLASLYEPVTHEERLDPTKTPFVRHLIHRFFQISASLVGTLVVISKAEMVLLSGVEDWPVGEALIVPHSKVVLGEPASLGTLLELGNRTLDILRNLVQRPPGVKEGVILARRNLEEILLYSVTQLAMWLSKPDFDSAPQSMDADAEGDAMDISRADVIGAKERRGTTTTPSTRSSITMAERLRRGMTGEMAGDLQSLLTKSKPIIIASDTIIGKPSVDLTQVLLNFLHERITGPS